MQDVTKVYAWQEALDLSKELARICEEFSDAETNVLVWHLRHAVVEIPVAIAKDLRDGGTTTTESLLKLFAELQLIHKIYPAIDTGSADEQLEKLTQRIQSGNLNESEPNEHDEEFEGIAAENDHAPTGVPAIAPHVDGVQGQSVHNQE